MRYAIAKNNKEDYGLVVLSLLASEQEALRKMEFSTLNHEAFQTHMFNMESEFVPEALNMKVHYKTTHTAGDGGQGNFRKTFRPTHIQDIYHGGATVQVGEKYYGKYVPNKYVLCYVLLNST
jgi:hypothetical protein